MLKKEAPCNRLPKMMPQLIEKLRRFDLMAKRQKNDLLKKIDISPSCWIHDLLTKRGIYIHKVVMTSLSLVLVFLTDFYPKSSLHGRLEIPIQ